MKYFISLSLLGLMFSSCSSLKKEGERSFASEESSEITGWNCRPYVFSLEGGFLDSNVTDLTLSFAGKSGFDKERLDLVYREDIDDQGRVRESRHRFAERDRSYEDDEDLIISADGKTFKPNGGYRAYKTADGQSDVVVYKLVTSMVTVSIFAYKVKENGELELVEEKGTDAFCGSIKH